MIYDYKQMRDGVFAEHNQKLFLQVRDKTYSLLREAGAARLLNIMYGLTGDTWLIIACVDRLVELGEIKELSGTPQAIQYRVFIEG